MTRRCLLVLIVGLLNGLPGSLSWAQEAERLAHFENAVRPLLVEKCLKCHGPQKSESGLRLDSRDRLLQGGDSGPAVVPGDAAGSLLLQAVRHEDGLAMPPTGRLKPGYARATSLRRPGDYCALVVTRSSLTEPWGRARPIVTTPTRA
jgi:hypothetical protein